MDHLRDALTCPTSGTTYLSNNTTPLSLDAGSRSPTSLRYSSRVLSPRHGTHSEERRYQDDANQELTGWCFEQGRDIPNMPYDRNPPWGILPHSHGSDQDPSTISSLGFQYEKPTCLSENREQPVSFAPQTSIWPDLAYVYIPCQDANSVVSHIENFGGLLHHAELQTLSEADTHQNATARFDTTALSPSATSAIPPYDHLMLNQSWVGSTGEYSKDMTRLGQAQSSMSNIAK
ncbi:hypothetical protein GGR57DRAFT_520211 [Xylariaceae sp. FL1272]|nr:hypothetical protein GGR57DRAFT_520211 [Xylariaceae sp. FL1272]